MYPGYSFFTKHQLFNDNQCGFRSGHSTEHAILEVINRIIDSNETPINIFLDLSKAFDTLDHSILLGKLQFFGMDADALKLMESYLKIENNMSFTMTQSLKPCPLPLVCHRVLF